MSVFISAWRKSKGSTMSATTPTIAAMTAGRSRCSGRGASGRRFSMISPRPGRLAPRQNIPMMIARKTSTWVTPGRALPPSVGKKG